MENIIIRDYLKEDYPKIVGLWTETGLWDPERNDSEQSIERALKTGGKFLVMVDSGNDIILGSSWLTFDGRRLHLHHFCIKPEYQRKGLGTRLAKASLSFVHSSGYQVKMEVHKENRIAKHLYEKLGFFGYTNYDIYMIRDVKNIIPENRCL